MFDLAPMAFSSGCRHVGKIPVVPPASACARSCVLSHGRACPRGLVAWGGRKAGRACGRGGLASGMGGFGWAGFWNFVAIRYYLQKIIAKQLRITPQSHRAHRDFRAKGFWAAARWLDRSDSIVICWAGILSDDRTYCLRRVRAEHSG